MFCDCASARLFVAINAIARGNSNKVQEIATLRSKGQSWTDLATSNGVNIASVTQTTRNAADLTASSYSNATERQKGGQRKLEQLGVGPQVRPQQSASGFGKIKKKILLDRPPITSAKD